MQGGDQSLSKSTYGTYGASFGGSVGRPPTGSTLTSLLARANALNDVDYDPELPQIRFGIDEIERMSEHAANKGKRVRGTNGEG